MQRVSPGSCCDGSRGAGFGCGKTPVTGGRGVVVTNHPRASAVAAGILLDGGNAVDAAIAALFALTVVEPMMVGILGGGLAHIRTPDGVHRIVDGMSTAPLSATPTMFDAAALARGDNGAGVRAVAVPGALAAWCAALAAHGRMSLADVIAPAIGLAARGFTVTHYLADCIADGAGALADDATLSARFLPGGGPLAAGTRLIQGDIAETLRHVAQAGPAALYAGAIGDALAARLHDAVTPADLAAYQVMVRDPVWGRYRGYDIAGPPPPATGGAAILQMLRLLEPSDLAATGFGTADGVHMLAQALAAAFATPGDPAAQDGAAQDGADTTHVTVADADGMVVASTQTLNGLFGAGIGIPGTGLIANNYMLNFDTIPGRPHSIRPGKRVPTSMAPMMALRDGRMAYAIGLPGGVRIFGAALQALVNLIDHGMTLQQAVEAPRIWTRGGPMELEPGIDPGVADALAQRGHAVQRVPRIAGGMGAIGWDEAGMMTGSACWRADGTPVAVGGGLAKAGVRFSL